MGEGFRLKTMRFKGQIFQGLLLPIETFSNLPLNLEVGEDVSEVLGVRKWEIEERITTGGTIIGTLPYDIPHTDETRVQAEPDLIQAFSGLEYYITTKMDLYIHETIRRNQMGSRAVITTRENFQNNGIGIYLHWHGDRTSIEGFLEYCKLKNYRRPEEDCYGWACLCHVITNYFGDGLSVGVNLVNRLDCDNGVYIIEKWEIVDRKCLRKNQDDEGERKEVSSGKVNAFVKYIDSRMPPKERLFSHSCL